MIERRIVSGGVRAAALIAVLGVVAWLSGQPFLFPSLGPTAYSLIDDRADDTAREIVGAHAIGVLAGLLAFRLFAPSLAATAAVGPVAAAEARLAASATLALGLTVAAMLATGYDHAPACATTLIVSLGLLATLPDAVVIVLAVVLLVGAAAALDRWRDRSATTGDDRG